MVDFKMPKFKFGESTEMVAVLRGMGLGALFESGHEGFGGMVKGDAIVSDIKHRAQVDVDEDGTEAAAATVVIMGKGMAGKPQNPVVFHVDEPFLFWIVETYSKMILFAGKIYDPVTEE